MEKLVVPKPLQLRLEALALPASRRIIFTVHGENLNPERIVHTYSNDTTRIYGDIRYRTLWIRNLDSSITFFISGDRPVITFVDNFLRRGQGRKLFDNADICYEGYRSESFILAAYKAIETLASANVNHRWGGSHV